MEEEVLGTGYQEILSERGKEEQVYVRVAWSCTLKKSLLEGCRVRRGVIGTSSVREQVAGLR